MAEGQQRPLAHTEGGRCQQGVGTAGIAPVEDRAPASRIILRTVGQRLAILPAGAAVDVGNGPAGHALVPVETLGNLATDGSGCKVVGRIITEGISGIIDGIASGIFDVDGDEILRERLQSAEPYRVVGGWRRGNCLPGGIERKGIADTGLAGSRFIRGEEDVDKRLVGHIGPGADRGRLVIDGGLVGAQQRNPVNRQHGLDMQAATVNRTEQGQVDRGGLEVGGQVRGSHAGTGDGEIGDRQARAQRERGIVQRDIHIHRHHRAPRHGNDHINDRHAIGTVGVAVQHQGGFDPVKPLGWIAEQVALVVNPAHGFLVDAGGVALVSALVEDTGNGDLLAEERVPEPAVITLAGTIGTIARAPAEARVEDAAEQRIRPTTKEFGRDTVHIERARIAPLRVEEGGLLVGQQQGDIVAVHLHVIIRIAMPEMVEDGKDVATDIGGDVLLGPFPIVIIQGDDIGVGIEPGEALGAVAMFRGS